MPKSSDKSASKSSINRKVDRYENLNVREKYSPRSESSNPSFDKCKKKHKLFNGNTSICFQNVKKIKLTNLWSQVQIDEDCEPKDDVYRLTNGSGDEKTQGITFESFSQNEEIPDVRSNVTIKNKVEKRVLNEWEIEDISSECEASPLKVQSVTKIDPIMLKKFASPISVPSSFSTATPIKLTPLITSQTPLSSKSLKKQSIFNSLHTLPSISHFTPKSKKTLCIKYDKSPIQQAFSIKKSNSTYNNNTHVSIDTPKIKNNQNKMPNRKIELVKHYFDSSDESSDEKCEIKVCNDSPAKVSRNILIHDKASTKKVCDNVTGHLKTSLNIKIDSVKVTPSSCRKVDINYSQIEGDSILIDSCSQDRIKRNLHIGDRFESDSSDSEDKNNLFNDLTPVKDNKMLQLIIQDESPEKLNRDVCSHSLVSKFLRNNFPCAEIRLTDVKINDESNANINLTALTSGFAVVKSTGKACRSSPSYDKMLYGSDGFDNTRRDSRNISITDVTPEKGNSNYNINDEVTPSKSDQRSPIRTKLGPVVTSSKIKMKLVRNLARLNSTIDEEIVGTMNGLESNKLDQIFRDPQEEYTENDDVKMKFAIDTFPSPSKDSSVMPFEDKDAILAEIPGLTPMKSEKPRGQNSEGIIFFSRRTKRLLKCGTLLSKAVSAINNVKSQNKIFSYELQVGLRSIVNSLMSDLLNIVDFWNDNSCFYILSRLPHETYFTINIDMGEEFIDNSVILIMRQKPKDLTRRDFIRAYYPVRVFYSDMYNCLIGIANHVEVVRKESGDIDLDEVTSITRTQPKVLNIDNYWLTDIFHRPNYKCSNFYILLKNSKSECLKEAYANRSLVFQTCLKVTILHSVISNAIVRFIGVDKNDDYCCIEFISKRHIDEIKQWSEHSDIPDVLECLLTNVFVLKRISLLDVRMKTLIEFCHQKKIGRQQFVYGISPSDDWSFQCDIKFNPLPLTFKKTSNTIDIDLNTTKRHKISLKIITFYKNKLTSLGIDSDVTLDIIVNSNFHHFLKPNERIIVDGLFCCNKQLIIDKFTHIMSL